MATQLHNLSSFDQDLLPDASVLQKQRYAVVVADWNKDITYALAQGAIDTLLGAGVTEDHILVQHVPGTVELTYAAAKLMGQVDAIIIIGCVIKGDTPHFDYVCQSVTQGMTELNLHGKTPVIFSVLTTLNLQQAQQRAGGDLGNKGVEGAYTAIRMANMWL